MLLVAVSTLYTKQYYVVDVIAGMFLASLAYVIFLRSCPRQDVPVLDRRLAPVFAVATMAVVGLVVLGFWIVFQLQGPR